MGKERIFELIRKEELVLFAGAGMSIYAGYPSGEKLANIMYDNLTNDFKKDLEFTNNLPKLTEDIYNLKGGNKNYLIEILKKEFQKEPCSTETHQLLAKIPQIKTVITTNYDTLFESTNKNIEVIRKSTDYPTVDSKKQLLFKIHGDLTDTEKIILTNADYNNYFSTAKEQTIFWNAVKDKLASNHVLFIGYSIEDSNISVILDKIVTELGDSRKEMFFVAPSITPSKLKFLQRKGIEFIESTGEKLINEINEDLKLNYFPSLTKGIGTADTALNFANSNKINLEVSKLNEGIVINNVKSLDENSHHQVKFQLEITDDKSQKILDSLRGKDFDDVNLEGDILKEYSHFFNGFRISNQENIVNLYVKKVPAIHGAFDIVFEDGFEINNYHIEVFIAQPKENETHLKIVVKDFTIILKIKFNLQTGFSKFKIQILPSDTISSISSGLNFYNILSKITDNKKFKLFKNNELFYNYGALVKFNEDALDAKFLFNYFQKLKKIEQHFDVRFKNIDLNDAHENVIRNIMAYIDRVQLKTKFSGLKFKNDNKDEFDYLIENGQEGKVLVMSENKKSVFELHNCSFSTGYLHQIIYDSFVANLEDLKAGRSNEIEIKSKTNAIHYQFCDDKTIISKG
ncbi:MAG TPA: SIR2 family protein [Flavobacterium sp.]